MKTVRLTVAQAIVRYLSVQHSRRDGVEQRLFAGMYGIFGHGNVTGIGQALEEMGDDLTYFRPQNEQAMVHTAVAFARAKQRLQMMACTSSIGPGATNMVTGAALATVNRLPVLLLPGDVFGSRIPNPVLQQLEHPMSQDLSVNDCFRPVSKFWDRIYRPDQLISSLPEAIRVLTDPAETGAVTLALPQDVQTEAYDFPTSMFEPRTWEIRRPVPPSEEIERLAALIRESSNPIIVCGGGVIYSGASEALSALASELGIPVTETQAGKSALPWDHPWNAGPLGSAGGSAANRVARSADLVIAIGTRLADFTTASKTAFQNPDVRFVGININAADAHKLGSFPVIGDARAVIEAVLPRLAGDSGQATSSAEEFEPLRLEWNETVSEIISSEAPGSFSQPQAIGVVNAAADPGDVVVCAAGGMPGDLLKLWRATTPGSYHVEYGYSCMGYEIAGGLGVKQALPDQNIFVMAGDGSYLMMHTEIVTSLQEGLKLIVVVVDNHGFRCIRELQTQSGSPSFGNDLRYRNALTNRLDGPEIEIDFAQNARSLGAHALTASTPEELANALVEAKAADRTTIIHVKVESQERMRGFESWWDVPIAEVSADPAVIAAREAYTEQRRQQRHFD